MELNGDEAFRNWNPLDLESISKVYKTPQVREYKEASHVEGFEDGSDDEEMVFIIKRFQYLAKKNKRFYRRSSGFIWSSSEENKDDCKGGFNCKKPNYFIVELQKDKSNKGSFYKDNFIKKFKKSLMATWNELDNEEESEKDEEQANLSLMALTSSEAESDVDSGSESEEEDKVFSKLYHIG